MAFTGLGREAAVALAKQDFHLETPSWTAPGSEPGSRIAQYLSANTADEERPGGAHVLVQSTLPLRTEDSTGTLASVSVALHETGGTYEPANPLVPLSISKDATSGASFLSSGMTVAPASASTSEAPTEVGNRLVWTGTATDTDFIAEPLPGGTGVEDSWQLRSQNSPEDNALKFSLPPGATLRMSSTMPGGAEVVMEGKSLFLIPPASARGVDGRPVPVQDSVSGDTLIVHVDLTGSVDFPVMVDPEVVGWYGEANNDNAWQNWQAYTNCGYGFPEYTNLIQTGINSGSSVGCYGEWYTGVASSSSAGITRVDVNNLTHQPANQSSLQIGITESNSGGHEIWTTNGYAGAMGTAPLVTPLEYVNTSMAFCAGGTGNGHDGGEQPLCNENYTGKVFYFLDDLWESPQTVYNYAQLTAATIRYVQTTPPTLANESYVKSAWSASSPYIVVKGEDGGVGASSIGLDAVSGIVPVESMPAPGSSPAPGTSAYAPACNDPFCYASLSDGYTASLSTGVWTLGAWVKDAVGLHDEQTYYAFVDKTPPTISEPSWSKETFGDGAHVLKFSAKDGSAGSPQSGVAWMEVYVDGKDVKNIAQNQESCPKPEGVHIIQAEPCYSLSGEWTLQGEDYGAGPHTVAIYAEDWAGNWEEKSFHITVEHPVGDSQNVGPGTLNLRSGDYTLGATDVSLPAGTGSLSVSRTYDSQSKEPAGPLGLGWLLSLPDSTGGGQWQSLQILSEGNVEAITTSGEKVVFVANGKGGFTSPTGFQTYSLTGPTGNPATYRITDPGGDYTQFTEPAGASAYMPTTVAQSVDRGGLNKVTYVLHEGKTAEIIGPPPAEVVCEPEHPEHLARGCRALTLHYATGTTATGEGLGEWGEYKEQLASVSFTAWNPSKSEMTTTSVAQYAYDSKGRLRAEWDPRISPALKTTYGYDTEGHITAFTPPGQEPWTFQYGTTAGDASTGRLISVTRPPAATALWNGTLLKDTAAPTLSGSAVVGVKMSVSTGTWSGGPVAYAYQWEDCNSTGEACSPILGATNATYTPAQSDIGHTLVARVTATNGGGSVSVSSAPSAVIGTPSYSSQFGAEGTGAGQLKHPGDVALDAKGDVWVLDNGNSRVEEFSATGGFIKTFGFGVSNGEAKLQICTSGCHAGIAGANPGQFSGPDALAIDSKGNVWIADTGNSRIDEFNEKGEYVETIGTAGSGNGQLNKPEGVAIDSHGNAWVSDTYNHRLEVFTENGAFSKTVTIHIEEPEHMALDAHGNVWVADWRGGVDEFNQSGLWLNTFTGTGTTKLENPYGIALESSGRVLVLDAKHNRVESFNEKGEYETQFGSTGSGAGQFSFSYPMGLASDSHGDVWVGDSNNNRVEKWIVPSTGSEEGATPPSPAPRWTIEYGVPVSGAAVPYQMTSTEVAKWSQSDPPVEATAVFPPDKTEGWPASSSEDYRHAIVSYFDPTGRLVNVASPGGAISMTQYDAYDNVERTLTPGNRQRALEAGSESAKTAELLQTKSVYEAEGSELESKTGPQHEVKLANGAVAQARAHTIYTYDQGAPSEGGPYRLVTTTSEGALLSNGEEKDVRTIKDGYSGQNNLGWELHKPTSVTVEPESQRPLTRTTVYNSQTGDVAENINPSGASAAKYVTQFGADRGGHGKLNWPKAMAVDSKGDVWIAETYNYRVQELSPSGEYLGQFGSWGTGNGQFEYPTGIALDSKGDAWVADKGNNRIEEFTSSGGYLAQFGAAGSGNGQFKSPEGLALDAKGDVWVVDMGNDRVQEFSSAGEYLGQFGSEGTSNGKFREPRRIAFDGKGDIWVSDGGNCRVQEFNEKREYVTQFGSCGSGNGQLNDPQGLTVDSAGHVWVADENNNRVQEFSEHGEYIAKFGSRGAGTGQFVEEEDVALNSTGNLMVLDSGNSRVQEFSTAGVYIQQFGAYGTLEGAMAGPKGVALDGKGHVWVADADNNRMDEYNEAGQYIAKFGSEGTGHGQFKSPRAIAEDGKGNAWVVDQGNDRLQELNEKGEYVREVGSVGTGPGQFKEPQGVTVDSKGDVWVGDTANNRVQEFNEKGEFVRQFGTAGSGNGQLKEPRGLAVDASGNVWVADSGNNRIEEFNEKGEYTRQIGTWGPGEKQFEWPLNVTLDASGHLWVTDTDNNRIQELTSTGEFLGTFGSAGSSNSQLGEPRAVAIDQKGNAWVADTNNNRITRWATAPSSGSKIAYYSAKGEAGVETCRNRPEWAGLPCQTQPTTQPEDGLPSLPVSTVTYNIWGETETTTEKSGSSERKNAQIYDAAGRLQESSIASSTGRSLPPVLDEYNTETGQLIKQSAGGKSIASVYNTLGQVTSYTDAAGTTSTYEYEPEKDGRLLKVNDGKGTQTYEYDVTTGQLTTLKDSGAGSFTATYATEGQLTSEIYPNGMKASYTYNSIGQTVALAYTKSTSTWYKDEVMPSIHGQWLSQASTLGSESYTYDGLGRMIQVQETPAGKGCTTYLYAYDGESNRIGETKREPGTGGACASEGGTTTIHDYDEANRLVDPGTAYEPLGEDKTVPASDAGGHPLENSYYADGALYSQTQNEQTNTYIVDPVGRILETTTSKGLSAKTTTSHYNGTGSTLAWTETEGSWTRNIAGIGTGLCATQTNGGEAVIQLANLHGDIIGTSADNAGAESATLKSEPTAFGVPTSISTEKYGWLGGEGLQIAFSETGVGSDGGGAYIPQLGLHLASQDLSGTASQDPVNEYLANQTLAQPADERVGTDPGAIEPLPVNTQQEKEFWENPPWDRPPEDPKILLTPYEAFLVAAVLKAGKNIAEALEHLKIPALVGTIINGLATLGQPILNGLAYGLELCYIDIGYTGDPNSGRCELWVDLAFSFPPVAVGSGICWGKGRVRKNKVYWTYPYCGDLYRWP